MFVHRRGPPRPPLFFTRSGHSPPSQTPSLVSQDSYSDHTTLAPASFQTIDFDSVGQPHAYHDVVEDVSPLLFGTHSSRPFGALHLPSSEVPRNKINVFVPLAISPPVDLETTVNPDFPHQWSPRALSMGPQGLSPTESVTTPPLDEIDNPIVVYDRVTPPDRTTASRLHRILAEATLPPVRLPVPPLEHRDGTSNYLPESTSVWNANPSPPTLTSIGESWSQPPVPHFDANSIPTREQLSEAAAIPVVSENGTPIHFGSLWADQRTIVIFTRRFR